MMKKDLKYQKKIYVPPIIEFEEIEELMEGGNVAQGSVDPYKEDESDDDPVPTSANDFDFSMDFVVNDEPQL